MIRVFILNSISYNILELKVQERHIQFKDVLQSTINEYDRLLSTIIDSNLEINRIEVIQRLNSRLDS